MISKSTLFSRSKLYSDLYKSVISSLSFDENKILRAFDLLFCSNFSSLFYVMKNLYLHF